MDIKTAFLRILNSHLYEAGLIDRDTREKIDRELQFQKKPEIRELIISGP